MFQPAAVYTLPIQNISEIEPTLYKYEQMKRQGENLPTEICDWMDYANNYIITSTAGNV